MDNKPTNGTEIARGCMYAIVPSLLLWGLIFTVVYLVVTKVFGG